jgi:hypothetical protein
MEIKGNITVFVKPDKNLGTTKELFASISRKLKKEKETDPDIYTHQNVKLILAKDKYPQEKIELLDEKDFYKMEVIKGFYTFEEWRVKDEKGIEHRRTAPVFYAQEVKILAHQAINTPKEAAIGSDLPF